MPSYTPEEAARRIERFAVDLPGACRVAIDRTTEVAVARALVHSSGTMTYGEMAAADYPYATRHGTPQAPLLPIHAHSEDFLNAWQVRAATKDGEDVEGGAVNVAPYSGYLDTGTRGRGGTGVGGMFARPLVSQVIAEVQPRFMVILSEEIGKAMRG